MMNHSVIKINAGFTNCYLIYTDKGAILIDSGRKNKISHFLKAIKKNNISPEKIFQIIITHSHFDHVGCLAELKKITTADIAAAMPDADLISNEKVVLPSGTNIFTDFLTRIGNRYFTRLFAFEKTEIDNIITKETDLSELGIEGRILLTPGHTCGSISVILNDGRAFVGDCMANIPFAGKVFPPFADDVGALLNSWKILINSGAEQFYPAHGGAVSLDQLKQAYNNQKKKF